MADPDWDPQRELDGGYASEYLWDKVRGEWVRKPEKVDNVVLPQPPAYTTAMTRIECERWGCGKPGQALHACPYQQDINDIDDPEYCNCCDDCRQDCVDDI